MLSQAGRRASQASQKPARSARGPVTARSAASASGRRPASASAAPSRMLTRLAILAALLQRGAGRARRPRHIGRSRNGRRRRRAPARRSRRPAPRCAGARRAARSAAARRCDRGQQRAADCVPPRPCRARRPRRAPPWPRRAGRAGCSASAIFDIVALAGQRLAGAHQPADVEVERRIGRRSSR